MLSTIIKYSYDTFAITSVVGYGIVQITAPVLFPIYAAPFFLCSAAKTAYHAAIFFHFNNFPDKDTPQIISEQYKDKNHQFTKENLQGLQYKLDVFEHEKLRNLYWANTCKYAKGLIPIVGYSSIFKGKTAVTSLNPADTWSDINALKYHIRHLTTNINGVK